MSEPSELSAWLLASGRGRRVEYLPLKGGLTLVEGVPAEPWLCGTEAGLLIAAARGTNGVAIDLLHAHPIGYEARTFGDRLHIGAHDFEIPLGKGGEARGIIGRARIRALGPVLGGDPGPSSPLVLGPTGLLADWLARWLAPGEGLLALLETGSEIELESPWLGRIAVPWRLVLTADRAALVAVGDLGDSRVEALPAVAWEVEDQLGGARIRAGAWAIRSPLGRDRALRLVVPLAGMTPAERLRAGALLAWGEAQGTDHALHLLAIAAQAGDPWAAAVRRLSLGPEEEAPEEALDDALVDALADLRLQDPSGHSLRTWFEGWAPGPHRLRRGLLHALGVARSPEEAAWSLGLHGALVAARQAAAKGIAPVEAEIALAEHLLAAHRHADATRLLEATLARLPAEDLVEILPPEGADLAHGEGAPPLHTRVLELQVQGRGGPDQADPSALAALARCQPLLAAPLLALVAHAPGSLRERAERALALHLPERPLGPPLPLPSWHHALASDQLERLRHPVEREGGVLGRMQGALAKVAAPDLAEIRSYCERATHKRAPGLIEAVGDAALLLGLPTLPIFLSQGERRVGIRSFERPEPFLLVGAAHLDPESDYFLDDAALRFAVGAEVAHLRFGHSRVTSSEVWAGIWDKGATAAQTLAIYMPLIRYVPVDLIGRQRAYQAIRSVLPLSLLKRVYALEDGRQAISALADDPGRLGAAGASLFSSAATEASRLRAAGDLLAAPAAPSLDGIGDLSTDAARLIAAHRVMQITADRAGLLMAGDLQAAVRAILCTHTSLALEWPMVARHGLAAAVLRAGPDGRPLRPHLALRLAALSAFWLSGDYELLAG